MNITVIGCGRWGSLITWYLDRTGHRVTLYGRPESERMQRFLETRSNDLLTLPQSVALSTDLSCVQEVETVIISIGSQSLRGLMEELRPMALRGKTFVLCMKGLEIGTGKRLSQVAREYLDASNAVAEKMKSVWRLGRLELSLLWVWTPLNRPIPVSLPPPSVIRLRVWCQPTFRG